MGLALASGLAAAGGALADPLPAGIKGQVTDEGLALADADGHLLYRLDTDRMVQRRKDAALLIAQRCDATCHSLWRPEPAPAGFKPPAPADAGDKPEWSVVSRGGVAQLAYKGDPLYRFEGKSLDEAAQLRLMPPYMTSYAGKVIATSDGVAVATLYWHAALYQPPAPTVVLPPGVALIWRKTAYVFADGAGRPLYTGGACGADCGALKPLRAPMTALALGDWAPAARKDGERDWSYRGRPVFHLDGDGDPGTGWRVVEAK